MEDLGVCELCCVLLIGRVIQRIWRWIVIWIEMTKVALTVKLRRMSN